jgi:hypothetical protein
MTAIINDPEDEPQDDSPNEDGPSPFSLSHHDPLPGHPSPVFNQQAYDAIDTSEAARLDRLAQRLQSFKNQGKRRTSQRTPPLRISPSLYPGTVVRTALSGPDSNLNYQAWIKLDDYEITIPVSLNPSGRKIEEFLRALGLAFDNLDLQAPLKRKCRVQVKLVNKPPPVYKIMAVLPPLSKVKEVKLPTDGLIDTPLIHPNSNPDPEAS